MTTSSLLLSDILRSRLHRIVSLYISVQDTLSFSSINQQTRNMILPLSCPNDNFITVFVHKYEHVQRVLNMVRLENIDMRMMSATRMMTTGELDSGVGNDSMYFTNTMKLISSFRNVRSLHFSFFEHVSDTLLFLTGHHCHDLIQINLARCREITDAGVMYLLSECPNLIRLNLSSTLIGDETLVHLVHSCLKLRSLDLEYCDALTSDSIKILSLCSCLIELNVQGTHSIQGHDIAKLAEYIHRRYHHGCTFKMDRYKWE